MGLVSKPRDERWTYLLGNGESNAIVELTELEDFVVRTRFLGFELRYQFISLVND